MLHAGRMCSQRGKWREATWIRGEERDLGTLSPGLGRIEVCGMTRGVGCHIGNETGSAALMLVQEAKGVTRPGNCVGFCAT